MIASSAGLNERARAAKFGGIAVHLGELVRHFRSGAHAAAVASLEVVEHLGQQARLELTPDELEAMHASERRAAARVESGIRQSSLVMPPLLSVAVGGAPAMPGAGAAPPPGSVAPPPLLGPESAAGPPPMAPVAPPVVVGRVNDAGSGAAGGFDATLMSAPSPEPGAVHRPKAPSVGPAPELPNLFVRSMLHLRAFGKKSPVPQPPEAPAAPMPQRADSVLGLKRQPSRMMSQVAPPRLDRLPSGLPPLAESPPLDMGHAPAPRRTRRPQPNVERGAGLDGLRARRASGGSRLVRRPGAEGGWRLGVLVGLGILVLFGAMVLVLVFVGRRRATTAQAAASAPSATVSAPAALKVPALTLTTESDIAGLLGLVHNHGKESVELRALVDEQAGLLARAMSQNKCASAPLLCAILNAPTRKVRHRPPRATRSGWMVGLKMPDFPVEDDRRVQETVEKYTTSVTSRALYARWFFRCGAYQDLIQSTLINYGLPTDILALVFAESGCEPGATSPVGAAGLWQFMPSTARAYHLRVIDGVVDERRSPSKSTRAAAQFLRDVYEKLGSWDLTFASYNMGLFGVAARIQQAGGEPDTSFWDLLDAGMLPDETADYVPRIQAYAVILNNLQHFNLPLSRMPPELTSDLVAPAGTRLSLIARAASMSLVRLRAMNPDILGGDVVPDVPDFAVQVPQEVNAQAREILADLLARRDDTDLCVPPTFDWGRQQPTRQMLAHCERRTQASAVSPAPQ